MNQVVESGRLTTTRAELDKADALRHVRGGASIRKSDDGLENITSLKAIFWAGKDFLSNIRENPVVGSGISFQDQQNDLTKELKKYLVRVLQLAAEISRREGYHDKGNISKEIARTLNA